MIAPTTTTADILLTWNALPDGRLGVDTVLDPGGNLSFVSGVGRLVQDLTRYLLTPYGSDPFDPSYGNPLLSLIGRPSSPDTSLFVSMVLMAQADFIARQDAEAALGLRSLDEQVDHFEQILVSPLTGPGGQVQLGGIRVQFVVVTKAGSSSPVIVPFTVSLSL